MKEKYIQLPPLPADMEIAAIEMIWRFAILDEEDQKEALEYVKSIDAYYEDEADVETFHEFIKSYESVDVSEEFREYLATVKRLVGRLIMDSYGMAGMIYQKRCVENKSVEEISQECGLSANKIQLFVDYFDERRKMEEEQ